MSNKLMKTVDGNEACASVAFRTSEIAAIYPITPSSTMGELADQWAAEGKTNIWGVIPEITEMQSEAGAAGAVHGAIQAGALGTTFTASQGLLLMIPNMYKIAGELTSFVMHVSARTLATHALSIFGDHSDIMACRQTGFAMLGAASVQEAQDMAAIAQASSLRSRVPFLHFFDGFRTSHEVAKIEHLSDDALRQLIPEDLILAYRRRALSPDRPTVRGTAQNPDAFFQAQEARNPYYDALPDIVQKEMDRFAAVAGRQYKLFDYSGHPQAEDVIVIMGSGGETVEETAAILAATGRKVGVIKVRLYRPFSVEGLMATLPQTVRRIAVLDRCKEPGAVGEPLYQDVVTALAEARARGLSKLAGEPRVIGGRYGLASKEFTPAMVKAVFDELQGDQPKPHFTVGINDDITWLSLSVAEDFKLPAGQTKEAVFFGLGADGTVGANKNSIKIIADNTDHYAQAYFVYDSKKSGGITISHLRFSPTPIHAPYLVEQANFVACHHFVFLDKLDVLGYARPGATFLLNAPYAADEVWDRLPRSVQQTIIDKKLNFYVIDARAVAAATGMGGRINTIMQTAFFALADVLPKEQAIAEIKGAIKKTYGRKSKAVVEKNWSAVDQALAHLAKVTVPATATATRDLPPIVPDDAPDFVQRVTAMMLANKGDLLPVSAFPVDGTWPVGTARYEKRNIADQVPVWEPSLCIQCNKCTMICPHSAIRARVVKPEALAGAPSALKTMPYKGTEMKGGTYLLQVSPADCTGCTLCVRICPGRDKANPDRLSLAMADKEPLLAEEQANFDYFLSLPQLERADIRFNVKSSQLIQPLFEFSGACLGCGETPYVKMLTQMYGDRLLMANATGCSSIYGANLPSTPYTAGEDGRGPAWSNSLFEDNAEFGLGFRLAVDQNKTQARQLLAGLATMLPETLVNDLLYANQKDDAGIAAQRQRVDALKPLLAGLKVPEAARLLELADYLVEKVVWIVGGDGWAYDIGYGGLDHVLASGRNVNILVMDTEVYSNTGGQQSKATPLGASAKFATAGKARPKKDLGLIALSYGNVFVASVAMGARDNQAVKALHDAASYDGVSLIISYANCIAHGYDMADALDHQKAAVQSGYWPIYRYDPSKLGNGGKAFELDAVEPTMDVGDFMAQETRFRITQQQDPERYQQLVGHANQEIRRRYEILKRLATN
jgi:pyruvate-ferredoxin/flavodoxin oxidoreductase